jgi:ribonuclease HI
VNTSFGCLHPMSPYRIPDLGVMFVQHGRCSLEQYLLYCDGSCLGNPGPGGWAYRVWKDRRVLREQSGTEQSTTNNRMELRAAIEGLNSFPLTGDIVVVSDSKYLISGMTELLPLWKARNWRSSNGTAVQNRALWQELVRASGRHRISWHWVRGHSGVPEQEYVDRLASAAAELAARAA